MRALAALVLTLFPLTLQATTIGIYYNRADWQSAMTLNGQQPLTDISFNDPLWTSQLQYLPQKTQLLSQSDALSATSGYSAPGMADNSTLGHVANGVWTDSLSKYGSTTFQFSGPIYGFSGDFNIAQANGLYLGGVGQIGQINGFIGFITDQPMDSLLISWGQSAGCPYCIGNAYTLANLELASLPTPEPNYAYPSFGILALLAAFQLRRKLKR